MCFMVLCYLFSSLLLHDEIIHLNNNICIVYIRTCLRSAALIHQSTHSMLHPKFTQMLKAIYSINIESVDNMNYYRWKGGGGALLIPFQLHASICVCVCARCAFRFVSVSYVLGAIRFTTSSK